VCVCVCVCLFVYIRSESIDFVHIILEQNSFTQTFSV